VETRIVTATAIMAVAIVTETGTVITMAAITGIGAIGVVRLLREVVATHLITGAAGATQEALHVVAAPPGVAIMMRQLLKIWQKDPSLLYLS
ncbi:hypothetical protein C0995_007602, partial [Termitomyces sp. Mi166